MVVPLSLSDFMKKYKLRNASTNNIKISEVINKLMINDQQSFDFDIYFKTDILTTKQGIINLSKKGTHWVCYYNNFYFDSYGVKPPKNIEQQLKPLIYSTFKIQGSECNDKKCASYCLYFLYLVNVIQIKEPAAVLFLFS